MRKSVLMIDDSDECKEAEQLLKNEKIPYVIYKVEKGSQGCCGGYTTETPSIFAPEGVFKGLDAIREYIKIAKENIGKESESAYW